MKFLPFLMSSLVLFGLGNYANASDIAGSQKTLQGSEVRVSLGPDYFNATMTISGPDGFYARSESKSGTVAIDLIRAGANGKGLYTYEVTAASSETQINANPMNNGRGGGVDKATSQVGVSMSGTFVAMNGLIENRSNAAEEAQ